MDNFSVPPNAVVVTTRLIVQTGVVSRTLETTVMVQTANWGEVVRVIDDCWCATVGKAPVVDEEEKDHGQ